MSYGGGVTTVSATRTEQVYGMLRSELLNGVLHPGQKLKMVELSESRIQIESLALRLAIERGDLQWETGILAAHHRLERTPVTRDDGTVSEDWSVQHRDFHQALLTGCSNRRLESVANSLRDSAELYRRWYWVLTDDHQRDLAQEHRQLKEFALAHNADRALEVLTEHIDRAPSLLIAYAREHGVDDLTPPGPQGQFSDSDGKTGSQRRRD